MKFPAASALADRLEPWDYMTMSMVDGKRSRVLGEDQELILEALRFYAENALFGHGPDEDRK